MKEHRLPDFLIVGTMKSGTSTLADYLAQNVDIHIPHREIHYFDNEENYNKGPSWYSEQLTQELGGHNVFENLIVGEKTPTYSYQSNCAERIKATIPNAKLIWIFRDPVKRTFSNYLHAKKKGIELLSFKQCVKSEKERIQHDIFKGYVERSKYIDQVDRFLKLYTLADMHFLLFEELLNSPLEELNKISDFLGVSRFEDIREVHSNKTSMPVLPASLYLANKMAGTNSFIYKATNKINIKLASLFSRKTPSIPGDIATELEREFAPYNNRLAELTGLDLNAWQSTIY